MDKQLLFDFKADISGVSIPQKLNNPFGTDTSEIVRIAAREFQEFITSASQEWEYDFRLRQGKMFGVLVVQKADHGYCYIGTVSGRLSITTTYDYFIPSVFDHSVGDFFIDKGMTELTEIGNTIKQANDQAEITALTAYRKQKSFTLQQRLFENYRFLNIEGIEKNILEIFKHSSQGNPPSAAGECAAPKLLQYALKHQLRPVAIAEFWWGNPPKNKERAHKAFYPACKDKCRPILEYMLNDGELYNQGSTAKMN